MLKVSFLWVSEFVAGVDSRLWAGSPSPQFVGGLGLLALRRCAKEGQRRDDNLGS